MSTQETFSGTVTYFNTRNANKDKTAKVTVSITLENGEIMLSASSSKGHEAMSATKTSCKKLPAYYRLRRDASELVGTMIKRSSNQVLEIVRVTWD